MFRTYFHTLVQFSNSSILNLYHGQGEDSNHGHLCRCSAPSRTHILRPGSEGGDDDRQRSQSQDIGSLQLLCELIVSSRYSSSTDPCLCHLISETTDSIVRGNIRRSWCTAESSFRTLWQHPVHHPHADADMRQHYPCLQAHPNRPEEAKTAG